MIESLLIQFESIVFDLVPNFQYVGSVYAPTLALGLFLFFLYLYRTKIEDFEEKNVQTLSEEDENINNCDGCDCGEGGCKKIKKISIVYGTETGMKNLPNNFNLPIYDIHIIKIISSFQ